MRKITLLLITTALLLVGVRSANVYAAKGIGKEFTSVASLSGKTFAIVNKAEGKAICNKLKYAPYDLQYLPYAEAFEEYDNGGYLFKVEQIDDLNDADANGKYLIRCLKGNGSEYSNGGDPYFQTNTTGDGVCFFFSLSFGQTTRGLDANNTATWDIQYDSEHKGFTLKNVGTGKYYNTPTKDAMFENPAYYTFCEVKDIVDQNVEITINSEPRNYQLYVPANAEDDCPLVISLHGAGGASTSYIPFKKEVADAEGCIVAYPQGKDILWGNSTSGWDATGQDNADVEFLKAVIEDVASKYSIDRKRIYCCGFSNGGMMTYAMANACSDEIAAFASISGFPLNEFHLRHTGSRPVPFMHIHGKADDFVDYALMPTIVDEMVARMGANPASVPTSVSGKYTKTVYEAGNGSFPYVYYEIDGMGHADYTENTEDGNSALTMWNFFEQYTLDSSCDPTLKWAPRIETTNFLPASHGWTVNSGTTLLQFGGDQNTGSDGNHNVYHSLQFDNGNYKLCFKSEGEAGKTILVQIEKLTDPKKVVFGKIVNVGEDAVLPFEITDGWGEYKLTITRPSADDAISISNVVIKEGSMPAKAEVKTPLLLLKNGAINTDAFTVTPITPSTLTTDNLYAATFTSTVGDPSNTFQYQDLDVRKYDKAVIKFGEAIADKDAWQINLPNGGFTALPIGITEYEIDLTGVDSYGDFTIFSWWHTGKSITISEVYLYTDKYVVQNQLQTVNVYALGTALDLSSVVTNNTLVSIASTDGDIIYGAYDITAGSTGNQIHRKSLNDAMGYVNAAASGKSTYRYKITEATTTTDEGLVLPSGVDHVYCIQAYNDAGELYRGPYWQDGYLDDLGEYYCTSVHKGDNGGAFFAFTPVANKTNTYKISSYKKDGTLQTENYQSKSEWILNVITQTQQQQNVDVWVELPTLTFNEYGSASTGYESITTTGGLSFNSLTGVLTTNGKAGTLNLEFADPVDLKYLNKFTVNRSGNEAIIDNVTFYDADGGKINTWNNSKLQNNGLDDNATKAFVNNNPVKRLVWSSAAGKSTDLTLTISGITWQLKTMTCVNAGETVLNTLPWILISNGSNQTPDWNMHTATDTYYGNYSGDATHYVDLSSYSELRVYRDNNDPCRAFFINAAGTGTNQVNTGSATWNADKKYWSFDLSGVEKWDGKIALKCIKANSGVSNLTVNNIVVYKTLAANAPKYVLAGSGMKLAETEAALADATATSIDATGVTALTTDANYAAGKTELTSANPNCLFLATANQLTNTNNVIVDGTCASLVLTDNHPFKAPSNFTATAATYATTISAAAQAGTLCLPFAATIPEDVTAYTLTYSGGNEATATAVETTIPANTPVLLNGSGEKTFVGSGAVSASATNESGAMTGVFAAMKAPVGSYVLQNGTGGIGFYIVAEGKQPNIKPFRAYLTAQSTEARLAINFKEPTGIKEVSVGKEDSYYNLGGQRVSKPSKGLYIVNGRKVVIK